MASRRHMDCKIPKEANIPLKRSVIKKKTVALTEKPTPKHILKSKIPVLTGAFNSLKFYTL